MKLDGKQSSNDTSRWPSLDSQRKTDIYRPNSAVSTVWILFLSVVQYTFNF